MQTAVLLSTAYFPPLEYFSRIRTATELLIEKEENYSRQTYRNRCRILAPDGILTLTVPVTKGSAVKSPVKDIRIDYSKNWQRIHLGALASCYGKAPWFQFYFEDIEKEIRQNHKYLMDLNNAILIYFLEVLRIETNVRYTTTFVPLDVQNSDFRYTINPRKQSDISFKPYYQVFGEHGFVPGLSVADLIFNMGPDSVNYL